MKERVCVIKRELAGFLIAAFTCGIFWFCVGLWIYVALGDKRS